MLRVKDSYVITVFGYKTLTNSLLLESFYKCPPPADVYFPLLRPVLYILYIINNDSSIADYPSLKYMFDDDSNIADYSNLTYVFEL